MNLRSLLKFVMPTKFIYPYRMLRLNLTGKGSGFSGNYRSWNEALRNSTGYDSPIILEKTKTALLKVKNGEAVHERDSVVFDEIQYSWPLLAGLMWVAAHSCGKINVLDFGGSLGSTYFQNRKFLQNMHEVRWNIIEQPIHVTVGKECFENGRLKFYANLNECLKDCKPHAVIVSGVLQYLEQPYVLLDEFFALKAKAIIIDRTPFWDGSEDRICVQNVPPSIFPASYPSWVFSRHKFAEYVGNRSTILEKFTCHEVQRGPVDISFEGLIITNEH